MKTRILIKHMLLTTIMITTLLLIIVKTIISNRKDTNEEGKLKGFHLIYGDLAVEVDKIATRDEKGDKFKLRNKGIGRLLEEYVVIEKK